MTVPGSKTPFPQVWERLLGEAGGQGFANKVSLVSPLPELVFGLCTDFWLQDFWLGEPPLEAFGFWGVFFWFVYKLCIGCIYFCRYFIYIGPLDFQMGEVGERP